MSITGEAPEPWHGRSAVKRRNPDAAGPLFRRRWCLARAGPLAIARYCLAIFFSKEISALHGRRASGEIRRGCGAQDPGRLQVAVHVEFAAEPGRFDALLAARGEDVRLVFELPEQRFQQDLLVL
jgi:hypothetical protein